MQVKLIWSLLAWWIAAVNASQTCNRFGNDLTQASPTSRSGVFANVSTPLTCTGNATGWNICYYNSTTDANTTTYFSVYRLYSGAQYYLVNGSLSNYTIARNSSRNYTCTQLPISRQYTVQPNDIIVVCVRNAGSGRLGIAGNVTGTSVLQNSAASCSSLSTSLQLGSSYIRISSITLHVNLAVNECAVGNGGCAHLCTDLTLGNNCSCNAGFSLDANGTSCSDINECSTNNGGCSQICNNTLGSNVCACNSGYYLAADNRTCNDTNECLTFNGNCSQNCNNTIGSYFCSCKSGYNLTADRRTCTDTNECLTNNGNCSQICNNTNGSYFCSCYSGYILAADSITCNDVNECLTANGNCSQICTNTNGSYFCSCTSGYQISSNNMRCNDIDECLNNNGWCSQLCTNTNGSYMCSCSSGYQFDPDDMSCDDINECSNATICGQLCRNTLGSYTCSCISGYVLNENNVTCTKPGAPVATESTATSAVIGVFVIVIVILIIIEAAYLYLTRCFKKRKVLEITSGIALSNLIYANTESTAEIETHNNSQIVLDNKIYGIAETNAEAMNSSAPLSETNTDASGKMHCGINSNSELNDIYADPNSPNVTCPISSTPAIENFNPTEEASYDELGPNVETYSSLEETTSWNPKEESPYYMPASDENELYIQIQNQKIHNIPRTEIEIKKLIGKGHFGDVSIGVWKKSKGPQIEVAIKTLSSGTELDDKVKFLQEAAIMAQFRHPNVVLLHGIVSDGAEVMLVIELAHKGDLRSHLNSLRSNFKELAQSNVARQLLNYSKHIAHGMQYLSNKSFVHRDLAARNILVVMKDKQLICKIADFGLSRDLADENYYVSKGGMVPVKWTAPEAVLYKKYSTASDVWSYGCLLYEIWSVGHKPFEGRTNAEAIEKVDAGYRLPPPPGCPLVIYQTMIHCWNPNAHLRPQFRDIHLSLSQYDEHVLDIPNEALQTHSQAGILGATLEAGQDMYIDLQTTYKS